MLVAQHEAKGEVAAINAACIIPAFGAGMCPKLVGEVKSSKRAVRVNALLVLCEEFKNPESLAGCVGAGVVAVLNELVASLDALTRLRASKALDICARDANGQHAMLQANTAIMVAPALSDPEMEVRKHVYQALVKLSSRNGPGIEALVAASYPKSLVAKAVHEVVDLQPLALRLLRNCLCDKQGLGLALGSSAVETCIALLGSLSPMVRSEAANTLCALCFVDVAKTSAIQAGAVEAIIALLADPAGSVRCAAAGALMAITTTDDGKHAVAESGAQCVVLLTRLLQEEDPIIVMNTLKCIANVAVHPEARGLLKNSKTCLGVLSELCVSDSAVMARHAGIARKAVRWCP
mmetsp:Transcript_26984/g.83942  ORF Transcript_26984/g.83942 Transcript_26984/m.83942 type:complete len:350 (+) Transcript_26984:138-1187(+)